MKIVTHLVAFEFTVDDKGYHGYWRRFLTIVPLVYSVVSVRLNNSGKCLFLMKETNKCLIVVLDFVNTAQDFWLQL